MTDPFVEYDQYGAPRERMVIGPYGNPVEARTLANGERFKNYTPEMAAGEPPGGGARGGGGGGSGGGTGGFGASGPGAPGGAGGTGGPGSTSDPAANSARQILKDMLAQWGLDSLYGDVENLIKEGLDQSAVMLKLQQTEAYKKRFAANELRRKKGLPVLSPAEYVATEASYRTVLRAYGLPETFYDSQDDYHKFLESDVSPKELQDRAQNAQEMWLSKDEDSKKVWRDAYGFSDGAAIAAILDPDRAMPVLQRMATASRIGGAAARNGLEVGIDRFERYADMGVTADDASKAFGQIGQTAGIDSAIAQRFGTTFSQQDQEDDKILGLASAQRKRQQMYDAEKGLFSEQAAASDTSMSRRNAGNY